VKKPTRRRVKESARRRVNESTRRWLGRQQWTPGKLEAQYNWQAGRAEASNTSFSSLPPFSRQRQNNGAVLWPLFYIQDTDPSPYRHPDDREEPFTARKNERKGIFHLSLAVRRFRTRLTTSLLTPRDPEKKDEAREPLFK